MDREQAQQHLVTGLKSAGVNAAASILVLLAYFLLFLAVFYTAEGAIHALIKNPWQMGVPALSALLLAGIVLHSWVVGVLATALWGWE